MAFISMEHTRIGGADSRGRGGLIDRLLHEIVRATGSVWARATLEHGMGFTPLADNAFGLEGHAEAWAGDPWRTRRPRAREQVFRCETYLRPETWRASPLYTQLLEPGGIDPFWALIGSAPCGDGELVLKVSRPEAAGPYSVEDLARAESHLNLLAQAVDLEGRARRDASGLVLSEHLLDSVAVALIVADAGGRIKVSNRAATRVLELGDWLTVDQGRLSTADPGQDAPFQKLLLAACSAAGAGAALLRIKGRSGWCTVTISSLRTPALSGALVAMNAAGEHDGRVAPIQSLFGLTLAESRLVWTLLNGESITDHAAMRGISVNTARVQLGSALKKTGARRQAELVALMASVPPVHF